MIKEHQPTIFGDNLKAGISSIQDGNMRYRVFGSDETDEQIAQHQKDFLEQLGITPEQTVMVYVTYDVDDFTRYTSVTEADMGRGIENPGEMVPADALATNVSGVALFLPLADCVGTIIYDPERHALMVSHLGRHETVQDGARKNVEYMASQYGCIPDDLKIWMSPSVSQSSYRMDYFDDKDQPRWRHFCQEADDGVYLDLAGYNRQSFIDAGVRPDNIEVCNIDTASDANYPTHIGGDQSRFAVVAMMP